MKKTIRIGNIMLIWWGRKPTFKRGIYPNEIYPLFKFWYFGLFEIRRLV